MAIEVGAAATVRALFRSLSQGGCELVSQPANPSPTPSAESSGSSPGVGSATGPAARVCAGTGWPPFDPRPVPGISVIATDRSHLTIRNATDRAWSYRLSGWESSTIEGCAGLVEVETERGPLAAGGRVDTTFGVLTGRLDLPVTLGLWDAPCGEACDRSAIRGVDVTPSLIEPGSS
jgi:hypothetical protein